VRKILILVLLLSGCGVQAEETVEVCEPIIEYVKVEKEVIVYVDRVETVTETIIDTVTEYVEVFVEVPVEIIVYETITKTKTNTKYVEVIVEVPIEVIVEKIVYVEKNNAVFIGDSITYQFELPIYENITMLNRGYSGKTTSYVLAKLDEILDLSLDKLFLLIGINDIAVGYTQEEITSNYADIVSKIKEQSPSTEIYLQSILPVSDFKTNINSGLIPLVNADIENIALTNSGVTYIDLYSLFADNSGNMQREYTIDGVHLTDLGYDIWIDKLRNDGVIE
jgi:hypothetical protein